MLNRYAKYGPLFTLGCLILFTVNLSRQAYINPPPWPDEAIYADIATTILTQHKAATTLWQGFVPGVEEAALWYPQLFFYLTALIHIFTGSSYISQRLVAMFAAVVVIFLLSHLFHKPAKPKAYWLALMPLLSLAVDYQFVRNARLFRPEIFVLLTISLALYLNRHSISKVVIGILCSIAVLLHPLSILFTGAFIVFYYRNQPRQVPRFLLGFFIPIMLWGY
jgi:hypothetical protein